MSECKHEYEYQAGEGYYCEKCDTLLTSEEFAWWRLGIVNGKNKELMTFITNLNKAVASFEDLAPFMLESIKLENKHGD